MTTATRNGLQALGAGLAVGLVGDLLLPAEPWGLNLLLCTTTLALAGLWIIRQSETRPSGDFAWTAVSALLLAAAFMRRDANQLLGLDMLALITMLGLGAAAAAGVSLRRAPVGRYVLAVFQSAAHTLIGGFQLLVSDVAWRELPVGARLGRFRGVALGVLIATPLLLVFASLFASADPAFDQALAGVLRLDFASVLEHSFRTLLLGGLAAGSLRGITRPRGDTPALPASPRTADGTAIVTALTLVNVLFLAFVVVQLRYFFGGAGRIETVAGLTYAEYARRGFFELVWATALVVPMLLGGDWAVRNAPATGVRRFRFAATITLGLLAVVMASALERMRLYVAAFGLTESRLYATAGMVFLAILLAWLGWTVLRGRNERFAFGATLQALTVLGGLHALNPDAFILRHNLTRPATEQPFDAKYAARLSADAAPLLLSALPQLSHDDACVVAKRLASWAEGDADWRTWNWSRSRAALIGQDPVVAQTLAGCPAPVSEPQTPSPESP